MRLTDRQRTATEKEGLTLTPSAFLFSRLLAAVEEKNKNISRRNTSLTHTHT